MAKTYRVGFASLVHDHVWGELRHWKALPNVELIACGDVNQELRDKAIAQGISRAYSSWQEMLEKEELDVVQAAGENNVGADIVEACAARGIHVISEKPMSARLSQANRMVAAATRHNTKLLVNWPTAWSPAIQCLTYQIMQGSIGKLFYLKYRAAHNGPKEIGCSEYFWKWLYDEEKNGAGAFMDYCCYAANMMACLLGLPDSVFGFRGVFIKDYPVPDDNAILVAKYAHAFGVAEACWTEVTGKQALPNPVAYGTEGCLSIQGGNVVLQRGGKEAEVVVPPPTQSPYRNAPEYLLHCLENNVEPQSMCSMQTSRDAQEILEAGLVSADSGKAVGLTR